nr:PREDICTED: uncharacterized protein LOC106702616 [Latimeria chalumnae]|eukprot:XP_014340872.1 PREDICTED: uncharacterized protein LOC106702616 [Latimeria chalumnae]
MTMAKSTVSVLKEMRCNDFASKIFQHIYELYQKNNYPGPCMPRKGVFPKNLGGGQKSVFQKPEDYYRSEILDTLINEIKDCFSKNDLSIFASLLDVFSSEWPSEESVVAISTTYSIDQEDLNSEIQIFFSDVQRWQRYHK